MTHMQLCSNISFLVGNQDVFGNIDRVPALPVFDERVIKFFSLLSERLLKDEEAKKYGDVVAYAFWIRKASIERAAISYDCKNRMGCGMAFHITPSNIPVQFAVSMVYALLAGNSSVIRVSSKPFVQVDIICNAINSIIQEECRELSSYICIIRYPHDDVTTQMLSSQSDLRLIWGGDRTIEAIKRIQAAPRCLDIGFSDRFSIAIIDSDFYLQQDRYAVAKDFFLDTYYTDQNACSSSRIVFWLGSKIEEAKNVFWNTLLDEVNKRYLLSDISGSEKLLKTALLAEHHRGIKEIRQTNALVRVELNELYSDVMTYKGNSGYFLEYNLKSLDEVARVITKECQTVTCLGDGLQYKIKELIMHKGLKGGDRIVPLGHSLDLSLVWDGYDMPLMLSRVIDC